MLDGMRRKTRTWGIKVLFAIIILVFVFWGVGGFRISKRGVLAKVNGEPILVKDFFKVYQSEYDRLLKQRPNLSSEDIKKLGLKKMVLNEMINQRLLLKKAEDLGIVIPDEKLREKITSMNVFKNKKKVFDPNRYKMILAANNITPMEFESLVKRDMRLKELKKYITSSVTVTDKEVRDLYDFVMRQGKIEYVGFDIKDFLDNVSVSDKEIKKYYAENKDRFKEPERIQLRYIKLTPDVLAPLMKVSDKEIEKYYNENRSKFFEPEQRHIRHILIRIKKQDKGGVEARKLALSILEKIKNGADFAKMAKKYSQGPSATRGGDIGWIKKGDTVKPFEDLAFSLKKGEVGGPVKTIFGYHLIKVEDIKKAHYQSLNEVKDKIRDILAREKANDNIEEFLDKVLDTVFSSNNLQDAGNKLSLPIMTTKLLSKSEMINQLHIKPDDVEQLFLMENNKIYETPIIIDNGYMIVQKIKDIPARFKSLKEVSDQIVEILKKEKAANLVRKKAESLLSKLKKGSSLKTLKLISKESDYFRFSSKDIPGLGSNGRIVRDLMLARKGEWLNSVYRFGDKFILVKVLDTKLPPIDQWNKQKGFWKQMTEQRKKTILFNEFLNSIRHKAKIEIVNREVLEN